MKADCAVHESGYGTKRTCGSRTAMSAIERGIVLKKSFWVTGKIF